MLGCWPLQKQQREYSGCPLVRWQAWNLQGFLLPSTCLAGECASPAVALQCRAWDVFMVCVRHGHTIQGIPSSWSCVMLCEVSLVLFVALRTQLPSLHFHAGFLAAVGNMGCVVLCCLV